MIITVQFFGFEDRIFCLNPFALGDTINTSTARNDAGSCTLRSSLKNGAPELVAAELGEKVGDLVEVEERTVRN
jgi:hypothetical protein